MRTRLFDHLVLSSTIASEVSQAVLVVGNAVATEVIIQSIAGTQVAVQLQESNDLQNWSNKGTATNLTAVGYSLLPSQTAVSAAFVRLKMTLTGTSAILSAGLNTSEL